MTSRSKWFVAGGTAVVLGACATVFACSRSPVQRPDGGQGLLPVGAMAPEIVGHDPKGAEVRLSGARGNHAVVYFYPKDETPGCTKEACAFRDAFARYQAANVVIFGVSRDSDESHQRFVANHEIPFPLVADPDGVAERAYGVSSMFAMSSRVTFLIGPDGKVERVWPDVDPGVHADQVLSAAMAK